MSTKKVCLVSTAPALMFMFHHALIPVLRQNSWQITGITSASQPGFGRDDYFAKLQSLGVKMVPVPICRDPRPLQDVWCLFRLWWFFLWHRFDVVHASNPKAMLIATVAAFFAFQPRRVITVRGRVYENSTGFKRLIFVWLDRITCACANVTIVVSHSLREAMLRDKIGTPQSLHVIANGSSQGCDATRFDPETVQANAVDELRKQCGLANDDRVILFAGRQRKDKGVIELVNAFDRISPQFPTWHLVLFGHEEKVSDIGESTRNLIANHPRIHAFDWASDLRIAYEMADIFALPTWREGFPNTVLEASAMQLPVITTNAVGAVDSIKHGETGFLVPVNDTDALCEKLQTLINDPEMRRHFGQNGRFRVIDEFQPTAIWGGILRLYDSH